MQNKLFDRVSKQFGRKNSNTTTTNKIAGALFWIKPGSSGNPSMTYDEIKSG